MSSASCASKRLAKTTGRMWYWQNGSFGEQWSGYLSELSEKDFGQ